MASKEYIGSTDLLLLCQLIYTEVNKYQEKVTGKGLSENDFTDALLTKLNGIAAGAEVNVQSDFNQSDSSADDYIKNKPDLTIYAPLASPTFTGAPKAPTAAAGADTTTIVNIAYLNAALAGITGIQFDADTTGLGYTSLSDLQTKHPTGSAGTIYLVQHTASTGNGFDEYFWNSAGSTPGYEKFGSTDIDLTNYLLKTDVAEISTSDVQTIWESVFGS